MDVSVDLTIYSWNLDGNTIKGRSTAGMSEKRLKKIKEYTHTWSQPPYQTPALALVQEIKTKKVFEALEKNSADSAVSGAKRTCESACFYYGSPCHPWVSFTSLDAGDLLKINDTIITGKQIDTARISCAIMHVGDITTEDSFRSLLVVSCHLKWKARNKDQLLKNTLNFLEKLRKDKKCVSVLMVGDFNFSFASTQKMLHSKSSIPLDMGTDIVDQHCAFHAEHDSETHCIDYMIVWPKTHLAVVPPREESAIYFEDRMMFNHPLVNYKVKFISSFLTPIDRPIFVANLKNKIIREIELLQYNTRYCNLFLGERGKHYKPEDLKRRTKKRTLKSEWKEKTFPTGYAFEIVYDPVEGVQSNCHSINIKTKGGWEYRLFGHFVIYTHIIAEE